MGKWLVPNRIRFEQFETAYSQYTLLLQFAGRLSFVIEREEHRMSAAVVSNRSSSIERICMTSGATLNTYSAHDEGAWKVGVV